MTRRFDAVHQFIPVLDPRDAASAHTLHVQQLLRDAGLRSDIYCEEARAGMEHAGQPLGEFTGGARVGCIYQFAIGSKTADVLLGRGEPLVVNSHNVTPAQYFEVWDPPLVWGTRWGAKQLSELAVRAELGLAVSHFNEAQLLDAGFARTATAPILFDPARLTNSVDERRLAQLRSAHRGTDWLFVGRIVPNKAQHDIIKALKLYRQTYDPCARLHLVGGASSNVYERALRTFIKALALEDAVELTGPVDDNELGAYFRNADVFVCLSDHEGFCVPLLEAMNARVPIVAYSSSAVGETVGGAAVLLDAKNPELVAAAVARVSEDQRVRALLVRRGRERLEDFDLSRTSPLFLDALRPWLEWS